MTKLLTEKEILKEIHGDNESNDDTESKVSLSALEPTDYAETKDAADALIRFYEI